MDLDTASDLLHGSFLDPVDGALLHDMKALRYIDDSVDDNDKLT